MSSDKKLTNPPTNLTVTITCSSPIGARKMTRFVCFQNYQGSTLSVPIALERTSSTQIEGQCTPEGLEILQSMAYSGKRNYWDQMGLQNKGGKTPLMISTLTIQIDYDISDSGDDDRWERLKIVDSTISQELKSGHNIIDLAPWARESRCRIAGVDASAHPAVVLAAQDIGKCGSDPSDQFSGNPKYANPDEALCSEFVSWYYHETGVVINNPGEFQTIDFTGQVRTIFGNANRLYRYNNATGKFTHSSTGAEYIPQSGDFLERREAGTSEHSMLVVSWDANARRIKVINGPWPVTLRAIRLSEIEQNAGKDFWLGRISPFE